MASPRALLVHHVGVYECEGVVGVVYVSYEEVVVGEFEDWLAGVGAVEAKGRVAAEVVGSIGLVVKDPERVSDCEPVAAVVRRAYRG